MANLKRAIEIARDAHSGQVDKGSADYIEHPLRVMQRVDGEHAKIVAVLHDVVEDCPAWTFDRLRSEGFSDKVLQALESVTKRSLETYDDFIQRAGANSTGRLVKLADLADNSDVSRLAEITPDDLARQTRYAKAIAALERRASEATSTQN